MNLIFRALPKYIMMVSTEKEYWIGDNMSLNAADPGSISVLQMVSGSLLGVSPVHRFRNNSWPLTTTQSAPIKKKIKQINHQNLNVTTQLKWYTKLLTQPIIEIGN